MKKILFFLFLSSFAWAQQESSSTHNFNDFKLVVKVEDQETYFNELLKEIPADKSLPNQFNDYRIALAIAWLNKGNIEKYRYYTSNNPEFSVVDLIFLTYALEHLSEDDKNLSVVEKVSSEILEKLDKSKADDEISTSRQQVLLEVNAMANAKLGKIDLAKKNIERSSTINGMREGKYFKDSKSNYYNRYAIVMSAAGQNQVAFDTLTKAFKEAESNPSMVATYKEVYKKTKGTDKGFEEYIKNLKNEAYQKYYKEVEKIYIATPQKKLEGFIPDPDGSDEKITLFKADKLVYDIALKNLDGKVIKFGDYKGKILAVDFWTTACTPCVAAFSGFEGVVADYKKDDFQMFVINIFETESTVKTYVAQKGIPLDVLRDEENTAYNIQGTPTKIIFDPMGNIRFYSAGYAGSTDREYYKLKAMVEIVKANGSK